MRERFIAIFWIVDLGDESYGRLHRRSIRKLVNKSHINTLISKLLLCILTEKFREKVNWIRQGRRRSTIAAKRSSIRKISSGRSESRIGITKLIGKWKARRIRIDTATEKKLRKNF